MEVEQLVEAVTPNLTHAGFRLAKEVLTGLDGRPLPFGDKQWVFSTNELNLEIVRDRGQVFVGLAMSGQNALGCQAWGQAVGIPIADGLTLVEQVDFFLSHLGEIKDFVTTVPDADARVRQANWKLVAPQIGMDPNRPAPGQGQ